MSFFRKNRFSIFSELDGFSDELSNLGYLKLAKLFQLYAIETAMSFYLDIKHLKVEKKFEDRIIEIFNAYFVTLSIEEKLKIPKLVLFKLSPRAYDILRNIKRCKLSIFM